MKDERTVVATSRVIADVYLGLDFPADWVDRETALDISMGREHLFSVMAWFDDASRPLAVCWRMRDGEERFAAVGIAGTEGDVGLQAMMRDLDVCSGKLGVPDLLRTLLWSPASVEPWQAMSLHRVEFVRGTVYTSGQWGWNMAPEDMVQRAGELLILSRTAENGLALPLPSSADAMRSTPLPQDPGVTIYLPVRGGRPPLKVSAMQGIVILLLAITVIGVLVSAWLGGFG